MKKKKEEEWEQGRIEITEVETKHMCVLGMSKLHLTIEIR